jgi:superfamily II DNA or RNA helicase
VHNVSVTLTNRHAYITDASDRALRKLEAYWSYYQPGYYFAPAYRLYLREKAIAIQEGREDEPIPGWDGKIRFFKQGKVPAGLFRATHRDVQKELGLKFCIEKDLPTPRELLDGIAPAANGYGHQNDCVEAMVRALPRGGGIITAATGTGKTATCARFFAKLNYPCLFVVHRVALLYQSQKEIAHWLQSEVGIVGDSEFDPRDVTVATIQTLKLHQADPKFEAWFNKVRIVVVDELHKQMAKKNFKLLDTLKPLARYGLTATLQLSKKQVRIRAWAFAGPVIYNFPIAEAIEKEVVDKGRVLQLMFEETYDWTHDKDYYLEYDYEVINNELKLNTVRVITKLLIEKGRYVLIIAERLDHIRVLDAAFPDVKHRLAYGGIKKTRREKSQAMFEDGNIRLMIASGVFKDGVNLKRVDAIIDMTEYPSKDDTLQKFGRGVRKHQDKKGLLFIDFGTQRGRFRKAAMSRSRAWGAAGLPVRRVKVRSVQHALDLLKKELECGKP